MRRPGHSLTNPGNGNSIMKITTKNITTGILPRKNIIIKNTMKNPPTEGIKAPL
jgi:hypothetical protein